jgi:hypothetical protein
LVQFGSAHHPPGTLHNGHIFYAFDLVLKFHTFVHTNQPSERFRNFCLPDRRGRAAKVNNPQLEFGPRMNRGLTGKNCPGRKVRTAHVGGSHSTATGQLQSAILGRENRATHRR